MAKEGEEGQKKLQKLTRYLTVGLAVMQASFFCYATRSAMTNLLPKPLTAALIILTFTAGTCFVVFLGERINERGIGNGVSLIIFAGIVTRIPDMIRTLYYDALNIAGKFQNAALGNAVGITAFVLVSLVSLATIIFCIYVQNAERRIPVQYSKKVIGRKVYGGQNRALEELMVLTSSSTRTLPLSSRKIRTRVEPVSLGLSQESSVTRIT